MMKKCFALLLATLLLVPAMAALAEGDVRLYESTKAPISFSYPAAWTALGSSIMTDEDVALAAEAMEVPVETITTMLESMDVMFVLNDYMTTDFTPSMNLVVMDVPGASEELLADPALIAQMKMMVELQISDMENASIEWVSEPALVQHGDYQTLQFISNYTMGEVSTSAGQALLMEDGKTYTFSISAGPDSVQGDLLDAFNALLDSIEIGA